MTMSILSFTPVSRWLIYVSLSWIWIWIQYCDCIVLWCLVSACCSINVKCDGGDVTLHPASGWQCPGLLISQHQPWGPAYHCVTVCPVSCLHTCLATHCIITESGVMSASGSCSRSLSPCHWFTSCRVKVSVFILEINMYRSGFARGWTAIQ